MEETLAFPKMVEIDLLNHPEKISSFISNRIFKKEDHIVRGLIGSITNPVSMEYKIWLYDHKFQTSSEKSKLSFLFE